MTINQKINVKSYYFGAGGYWITEKYKGHDKRERKDCPYYYCGRLEHL